MRNLPPDSENLANELAKERSRASAEQTLMAWIRTSLSLISFGIGIEGIINAIYGTLGTQNNTSFSISRIASMCLMALGTISIVAATIEHPKELRRIKRGDFSRSSDVSLALIVAIALCLIGLFSFLGFLIRFYHS